MDDVKQRLRAFIAHEKLTVMAFEARCGLSNGYVASMRKSLGEGKLRNVLTVFPQLNRDWLLYGEGDMIGSPQKTSPIVDISNVDQSFNSSEEATIAHLTKIIEEQRKRIDYLTDRLLEKQ